MLKSFFITGTDTEIGKTYVTACLAFSLKQQMPQTPIWMRKPIASGAIECNHQLQSEDAIQLKKASQSDEPLAIINPFQFKEPISPARAIQLSNQQLKIADLASACNTSEQGIRLIEGAGGFYSPIALDGLNADLADYLEVPIVLVVGNRLGCINHALLTTEAILNRGLKLQAVIINDLSTSADPQNVNDLKKYLEIKHAKTPFLHLNFQPDKCWQNIPDLNDLLEL